MNQPNTLGWGRDGDHPVGCAGCQIVQLIAELDELKATLASLSVQRAQPSEDEREALKVLLEAGDHDWSIEFPDDPYGARADAIFAAGFTRASMPSLDAIEQVIDPDGLHWWSPDAARTVLALFTKGTEG